MNTAKTNNMTQKKLLIKRTLWLDGPNIWTYRSCIEALVDIQDLEQFPSNLLPGFYERLTALLPGLVDHECGIGEPGGFLIRLRDGTYAAHILEHITIELHLLAGLNAGFGKARETSVSGVYKMVFRTPDRFVGMACLEAAVRLIHACIEDTPYDLKAELKVIQRVCDMKGLGPSTQHIVDAAYDRRIPFIRLNDGNLVQIGYGEKQQRIWTAETSKTSAIAEGIASDKQLCKDLLSQIGIPVPEGREVDSADEAWEAAQDIGVPVVVKPTDANHGRGVSLELSKEQDIREAYALADEVGSGVLVEKFIAGHEHRLLIINNQMVAATRGELVFVTGDGKSTLLELVESQLNSDPQRGWEEYCPLDPVDFGYDPTALYEVRRQGFEPESVVPAGHKVLVQRNSNASEDVTDIVHPEIARLCTLAAKVIGLDIAGVDLMCEHIDQPPQGQAFAIVEVNAGPGLLMHIKPSKGTPRNVGAPIIESLFPQGETGRIPIITYTGGPELSDFGPQLCAMLEDKGHNVGLACEHGLWVNGKAVHHHDAANWESGRNALVNNKLNTLIMQVRQSTILSEGLPFDRNTVAVVTHLGQLDGLQEWDIVNHEKLFNVTRTVIDLVLPTGYAVLNADEVSLLPLQELCDGKVVWISTNPDNPVVREHVGNGGIAVVLHEHAVQFLGNRAEQEERKPIPLDHADENPIKQLALAACGWVCDVPHHLLRAELRKQP
ncbi:cyanophycin synthetase [Limnobacter humi]|uniref:Cyanophycin synthetase n=1 Tax=Limnobacter humi TaxID=1778671 RepID=A0ABT1WEC9_9BURK|nr:cyanophycin synthetase [Limnobacter humi]MCQ8895875.1 cyanophycin synthetase [Limnobacter humi]